MCLSFPAYAGHVQSTGVACSCNTAGCIEDYEGECGGHSTSQQVPTDYSGLAIVLVGLLFWLRTRA
jgi:hypothetical protein